MSDEPTPVAGENEGKDKIDFETQPPEIKALFEKLLEDKRQANKEAQAAKKTLREIEAAKEQADKTALEQQAQFKTLYEKEKAAKEQLESEVQVKILDLLREKVGIAAGLPPALIKRLQGTTEDELAADAELIKAALPTSTTNKPSGTQSNTTSVPRGTPSGMTDEQLRAWLRGNSESTPSQPRKEGNTLVFGG